MFKKEQNQQEIILHKQFVEYGRNSKEWLRKCALLLPEIDRRQIWKKKRFSSIYEYAAKLAGMSKTQVDLALWTVRKIEDKPELMKVAQERGIHAVRPVANVATIESDAFWAQKAKELTKNALEAYVREIRQVKSCPRTTTQPENLFAAMREIQMEDSLPTPPTPPTIRVPLDLKPNLARRLDQLKKRADFEELLERFVEKIEARMEAEKPEIVEDAPRYVHAEMDHYVTNRTGGKCAFPGCNKPIDFLHHTQRYALEKIHDPDRLWGLCRAHNEIAHNGLIENEEGPPSTWRLRNEPDRNDAKYWIDQQVATYRKHG